MATESKRGRSPPPAPNEVATLSPPHQQATIEEPNWTSFWTK